MRYTIITICCCLAGPVLGLESTNWLYPRDIQLLIPRGSPKRAAEKPASPSGSPKRPSQSPRKSSSSDRSPSPPNPFREASVGLPRSPSPPNPFRDAAVGLPRSPSPPNPFRAAGRPASPPAYRRTSPDSPPNPFLRGPGPSGHQQSPARSISPNPFLGGPGRSSPIPIPGRQQPGRSSVIPTPRGEASSSKSSSPPASRFRIRTHRAGSPPSRSPSPPGHQPPRRQSTPRTISGSDLSSLSSGSPTHPTAQGKIHAKGSEVMAFTSAAGQIGQAATDKTSVRNPKAVSVAGNIDGIQGLPAKDHDGRAQARISGTKLQGTIDTRQGGHAEVTTPQAWGRGNQRQKIKPGQLHSMQYSGGGQRLDMHVKLKGPGNFQFNGQQQDSSQQAPP